MASPIFNNRAFVIVHTVFIYVGTICLTIVLGLLAVFVSILLKNDNAVHGIARLWGRCILWISGVRVSISGLEQLASDAPYIYMANHQSQYDIPVLLSTLPSQWRFVVKAELFKIPIFGRGMRGAGYISIDRSDRRSAFLSLARAAQSIRNGSSVVIFPEGTRSQDGDLLPFKKGGFVLAVDSGVPVVPVIIHGAQEIMPKGSWLIRCHRVHIDLLTPIDSSLYTRKTKDELLERVRVTIATAMNDTQSGESDPRGPNA